MTTSELYSWADLVRTGSTQRDVRRALGSGELDRVRRGVYADAVADLSTTAAHRRLVQATWPMLQPGAAVSHFSAAVVHGLPTPPSQLDRIWLTRPGRSGKIEHQLHLCRADLAPAELTTIDDVVVTSLARTAADCTRRLEFDPGVILMDAALRAGADPTQLAEVIHQARGRRGNSRSRLVASVADGRSESPGESLSRMVMRRHDLPTPDLQVEVYDDDGLIGRGDFGWRGLKVLGEFDGRVKYGRDLAPGHDPVSELWREKQREDRLRRAGWLVIRWTWSDLGRPVVLVARIRQTLDLAVATSGTRRTR